MEAVTVTFADDRDNRLWNRMLVALRMADPEGNLSVDAPSREINIGPIVDIPTGPVVVAGIGALSAALGAILTYLTKMREGPVAKIIIKGKDGSSVEVPRDVAKEDVEYYIAKARELGATEINLFGK
jgi:hypothetical protein